MATDSSVLAWRIPGVVEPGGLPSMGSHRVGHDWSDLAAAAAINCSEPGISRFSLTAERPCGCVKLSHFHHDQPPAPPRSQLWPQRVCTGTVAEGDSWWQRKSLWAGSLWTPETFLAICSLFGALEECFTCKFLTQEAWGTKRWGYIPCVPWADRLLSGQIRGLEVSVSWRG